MLTAGLLPLEKVVVFKEEKVSLISSISTCFVTACLAAVEDLLLLKQDLKLSVITVSITNY